MEIVENGNSHANQYLKKMIEQHGHNTAANSI